LLLGNRNAGCAGSSEDGSRGTKIVMAARDDREAPLLDDSGRQELEDV
jgi:hypothetical protein